LATITGAANEVARPDGNGSQHSRPGWPDPYAYRLRAFVGSCRPVRGDASGATGRMHVT